MYYSAPYNIVYVFKTFLSAPLVVSDVLYTCVRVILSMGRSRGEIGGPDPLENHNLVHVYVSLEILVLTPLERQLDPLLLEGGPCGPL